MYSPSTVNIFIALTVHDLVSLLPAHLSMASIRKMLPWKNAEKTYFFNYVRDYRCDADMHLSL